MTNFKATAVVLAGLASFAAAEPIDDAAASIKTGDLRAHVEFLASDELEGRATLTKSNDLAARYIAEQMRRAGLAPAGPDGSFFQDVPLWVSSYKYTWFLEMRFQNGSDRIELEAYRDFTVATGSGRETAEGGVVFAGFGITAPEYGWDDYRGIDVKGKVVVVFRAEPQADDAGSEWDGRKMTKHALIATKIENARLHGAAALAIVNDPCGQRPSLFQPAEVVPDNMAYRTELSFERGEEPREITGGLPTVFLGTEAACRVLHRSMEELKQAQRDMDAGKPAGFEIPGSLKVRVQVAGRLQTSERKITRNVAGVLTGGRAAKMREVVIVSAHHDGLGIGGQADDTIFNGADGSASGVAGLLEIAEAMAAMPERPDRTVLFIAFTGKEAGMLGSRWYARSPLFPLKDTVAVIGLDSIGRNAGDDAGMAKVATLAGGNTSPAWQDLTDALRRTTGLDLRPTGDDPVPGDFQTFRDCRVPALTFFGGIHRDSGKVSDTADKILLDKAVNLSRAALRATWDLATNARRPAFQDPGTARPERAAACAGCRRGDEIILKELSDEEARAAGLAAEIRGLRVWHSRSPLLQDGDIVLEAGDRETRTVEEFMAALANRKGKTLSLFVQRGPRASLFVTLGEKDVEGWKVDPK